jgi:hypothetical protein
MFWLIQLLLVLIFPAAFLIAVVDIIVVQARNRGRSAWAWALFGSLATVAAGTAGFFAWPFVHAAINPDPQKSHRLFYLSMFLPAVVTALAVGGLLRLLGPVARRDRSFVGSAITQKADEWHIREQCRACGFFFEVGDMMCQCQACAAFYHMRCWNEASGCAACAVAPAG